MTAIREFLKVEEHQIHYRLPDNFDFDEVEIIILPKHDSPRTEKELNTFSNHSASTITEWLDESEDEVWK
jgi:hypothetical protein